jgi:DNA-binding LytR/AlgR family response regulator
MTPLLNCLVVHHRPQVARSLVRDLHKVSSLLGSTHTATTLDDAIAALHDHKPNVVVLDLEMPSGGAYRFLQQHLPADAEYLLILLDKDDLKAADRQRNLHLLAEHQAVGYLILGVFNNGTLEVLAEKAHGRLQSQLLAKRQRDIIELLIEMLVSGVEQPHVKNSHTNTGSHSTSGQEVGAGITFKKKDGRTATRKREVTVQWQNVIRCVMKGNDYEVWYFDEEGAVTTELLRKERVSAMPAHFFRANRSHIVNPHCIARIGRAEVMMMCGNVIQLSQKNQERMQTIFNKLSVPLLILSRLNRF